MSTDDELPAILYVPLPGLEGDQDVYEVAGMVVGTLDVLEWRAIENNRTTDIYTDEYQAVPRYFAAEPIADNNDADEWNRVVANASRLVLSMLLCGGGDLIAPHHTTVVARSNSGINLRRRPGKTTSRFLAVTFGEDRPVLDTGRSLYGLGGEPYFLTTERAVVVEEMAAVVEAVERIGTTQPAAASALAAGKNYALARSVLLAPRVRFIALFAAIEIVLGGFGEVGKRPGLGHLVATLHFGSGDRESVGDDLEDALRSFRNATVHGGKSAATITQFLDELVPWIQPLIRAAYVLALDDDRRSAVTDALKGRASGQPSQELQTLLRTAYRGSADADAALTNLDLRSLAS